MSKMMTFHTKFYKKSPKGQFSIKKGPSVYAVSPADLIFILALTGQKYFRLTLYNEENPKSVIELQDFNLN